VVVSDKVTVVAVKVYVPGVGQVMGSGVGTGSLGVSVVVGVVGLGVSVVDGVGVTEVVGLTLVVAGGGGGHRVGSPVTVV